MKSETIVRLKITSEIHTPEFISGALGINCDRGWKIGDLRSHTIIRETVNGWILGSGLEKTVSLDEHLSALLRRIEPIKAKMNSDLARDNIEISCVIYAESAPPLNFDSQTMSKISALGASLDIDLYIG